MSTVGCVSSKTRFTKPGCRKYRLRFRLVSTLLEMSVAKQVKKKKHKSSALRLEQVVEVVQRRSQVSRRSYNCLVADTHSISLSRYWFIVMQCHHILMRELENGVTREVNQLKVPSFGIDIACHVLIKGCLTL